MALASPRHRQDRPLTVTRCRVRTTFCFFSPLHVVKCRTGCCHSLACMSRCQQTCYVYKTAQRILILQKNKFMFLVCHVCVTHLNLIVKVLVYFSCLFQYSFFFFFPATWCLCSAHPNKVYCPPFKKKKMKEKKSSVPDLIACRSGLIHNAALLLTPQKIAASQSLLCPAAMAASLSSPLKSISADGKKMAGT